MTFGATLRALRVARGLRQDVLAARAACDRGYISLLERDKREPSRATVRALSAAFGLTGLEAARFFVAAGFCPSGAIVLIGANTGGEGPQVVEVSAWR